VTIEFFCPILSY